MRRLIGLTVLAATTLSACGGSSDTESLDRERERQNFLSRILPSGDFPGAWNHIWGCDVNTLANTYSGVPLRFYRDGQLQAGIGASEVLGTWKLDTNQGSSMTLAKVVLTLDEAAPQFFGTDGKQPLLVDLWFHGDSYMESNGILTNASGIPEDTVEIDMVCVRYNKAGDVEGDDLPGWLRSFDETPTFITTGQASIQVTPTNPSSSDQEAETIPPSDEPTSEPVNSPSADPAPTATQPSTTAPLADVNAQVKDIWFTNDLIDTVNGVRQRFGTVIEFNNGEVSRDGETISNEGIAASKRKNPQYWGLGRVSNNGLLSYKWSNSRSWLEPFFSAPTRSYPRNQKISGCYENSTGVKGLGSSPLIKRLCLSEDGSFRLDDAGNNTGNYLIEKHAIRLNFSSGERAEFLIGGHYEDGIIYRLIIGDVVFYVTQ